MKKPYEAPAVKEYSDLDLELCCKCHLVRCPPDGKGIHVCFSCYGKLKEADQCQK